MNGFFNYKTIDLRIHISFKTRPLKLAFGVKGWGGKSMLFTHLSMLCGEGGALQ
jgi:hypothetical protein